MTNIEDNVINLINISKSYYIGKQEVPVLTDINLSIKKGEFVSIMGSSGAGKSTLMNILGCLDRPTTGSYLLNGKEVANQNDDALAYTRNKEIGFVFQSFNLIPRLSALDNVILPMIYGHVYKSERKERALHMLELVGLESRIDHVPAEMSGGQRQRVAIARALINNPSIIMADEPTGNLDSKNSKEIVELLKVSVKKYNQTLIMITHDTNIALQADRVITIEDGIIKSDEVI